MTATSHPGRSGSDCASRVSWSPGGEQRSGQEKSYRTTRKQAAGWQAQTRENPADLFTDPHNLPIVALGGDAPADVRACFAMIRPGSVAVAVQVRGVQERVAIYYEGDVYSRPEGVEPTPAQRVEYARIAAGRARDSYPTVARFFLPDSAGLVQVGRVDLRTWQVEFNS